MVNMVGPPHEGHHHTVPVLIDGSGHRKAFILLETAQGAKITKICLASIFDVVFFIACSCPLRRVSRSFSEVSKLLVSFPTCFPMDYR